MTRMRRSSTGAASAALVIAAMLVALGVGSCALVNALGGSPESDMRRDGSVVDGAQSMPPSDASNGPPVDGAPDAPPPDAFVSPPIPTGHNIVFVTSIEYDGNLGGLGGADAACQSRAAFAGLPGTYVAWLSTPTVSAHSRIQGRGWVRRDGRPFVDTIADLEQSKMLYPVLGSRPRSG